LLNRGGQKLVGREIPGVFDLFAYRVMMRERCCSTYFFNFKALGCTNSQAHKQSNLMRRLRDSLIRRQTTTAAKPVTSEVSDNLALSFLLTSDDDGPF
jgi:hypothetical protein